VSDSRVKKWARDRMAPETWDRAAATMSRTGHALAESGSRAREWASIGSDHVTSMRAARTEPWRLVFALLVIIVPGALLSIPVGVIPAVPVALFLIMTALSTYVADWVGGVTSTAASLVVLDLIFMGDRWTFDVWDDKPELWVLFAFLISAAGIIMLFEHMKYDRASAKLEAAAMRAANTAFNAVEIAAASRPAGDSEAFVSVLQSILTAMVRVNRASAGALYLVDAENATLIQAATYGDTSDNNLSPADDPRRIIPIDSGFAGRIAMERRPISIADIGDGADVPDVVQTNPHVRSVVGVPIFGPTDSLAGVAWVGLYVSYRFSQTSIARLQALAHRTVAFMESARLADAQEELLDRVQDNHRRLQSVIQTMPEAVMVARPPHGVIVTYNAAAQRMFGLQPQATQLVSRRVDQLRISSDPPDAVPVMPMVQAMREGITVTGVELQVRTPNGSTIPVVASAAPLRTDEGNVDAVVGVFQDVSPLKEAERLRDEFISVVSHELRSPLTPIRGFAQIIARDLQKEGNHDQHVAWLQTLQQHTDRLTRLVDDLLDVSRMRAGRLQVLREDVDVVGVARSVVESRRAAQTTHAIVLDTDLPDLHARLDGDRIHQVVDNLVGNAIKYTDGGTVTVGLELTDNELIRISVSDEGHGIPARERESLFTAFYRARSANESAVPGLGLGLYIVRELVVAHGGTITAEEAPGGGAMFIVEIPRQPV
jgi:PAS domain S-box-containing protein